MNRDTKQNEKVVLPPKAERWLIGDGGRISRPEGCVLKPMEMALSRNDWAWL